MTETSSKIKGVLLATLVVLSVFAGVTGTAVAATNPTNGSVSPTDADEQTTAQHDFHLEVDGVSADGSTDEFYIKLPSAYAGNISIDSVSAVNSSDSSDTLSVESQNIVDANGDGDNSSIKVSISPDRASDVDVTLDVTATLTHPAVNYDTGYAVTADVVDSGNSDVSDHALGTLTVASDETNVDDGKRYWKGQVLSASNNLSGDEVGALQKKVDGDYQFDRELQATNGVVVLNTDNFDEEGYTDYKVVDENGDKVVQFAVAVQSLSVTSDDSSLINDDSDSSDTTFEFDSNRANYNVVVEEDSLTTNETESFFENAVKKNVDDDSDNEVVLEGLGSNTDVLVNATNQEADSYDFNFSVTDTSATASTSVTVSDENPSDAMFGQDTFENNIGDVAEFTIELENTDTADFQLGSEGVGYSLNGTVTDGNDDDVVTVQWNTYEAGNGNPLSVADDEDSVTVSDETTTVESGELEKGQYGLDLFVGPNDKQTDISLVNLEERTTGPAQGGIAPDATDDNLDAVKDSTTFDRDEVAMGDKVVLRYDVSGIFGYIDEGTLLTEGGNTDGVYVSIEETDPEPNTQANTLDVSNGQTYLNSTNNVMWVVLDTDDYEDAINMDDTFNATLHVTEDNPYVEDSTSEVDEETAQTRFTVVEESTELYQSASSSQTANSENPVNIRPVADAQVKGTTTLAPGTEVSITATGDTNVYRQTVEVQEDGTFAANFDYEGVERGTELTLKLSQFDIQQDAVIQSPLSASASAGDQTVTAGEEATLTVDSATLSEGGFVALVDEDDNTLGSSELLNAGEQSNIQINVGSLDEDTTVSVVAFTDADDSGSLTDADERYTSEPLAEFSVTTESVDPGTTTTQPDDTTDDQTTTQPDDTTTTPDNTTTAPSTTENNNNNNGIPGFGAGLALVAIIGAGLIALRN